MAHDARTLELLRSRFGEPLKPALRRLAEVPEGARVEFHEGYLFPVISMENVVILPGVPSLLREGFLRIRDRFRVSPIHGKALYFTVSESTLAEHLQLERHRFADASATRDFRRGLEAHFAGRRARFLDD